MNDTKQTWLENEQRKLAQANYTVTAQLIKQGEPNLSLPTVIWREFQHDRN